MKKLSQKIPGSTENDTKVPGKDPGGTSYKDILASLSDKYARFVEEYLIDLDATKAAIRAGYTEHSAGKQGYRLTKNVHIRAAIEAGKAEISKRNLVKQDEVIRELTLIGFADMADFVTVDRTGSVRANPLDTLEDGKSRIIKKIKEKRTIRLSDDGDQALIDSTLELELCDKVGSLRTLLEYTTPAEPQKVDVTVTALTNMPPRPRTMAEWEALVKGGKI